ncbi:diacylglycerol kinase [Helicobacter anatolicus]|uniref:diacylglycerol kinase n=1 Tax=Helicobacter anatolicus TaxID=2905874 RepID=UPI001E4BF7E3|nr:diacylglycerol kinase [Helicobacter anatolicus]MCE3039006.1 diacylglycerol kinase [Helicobacter anatolicus]
MEHRNNQKGKKGIKRIYNALFYSLSGIAAAWRDEAAFRQIFVLGMIFGGLGLWIGQEWTHKILLVLPCFLCIVGELINSAIENAVDFTGTQTHPLAKKAKDMGSAIQLVLLVFFVIVWISYLFYLFFKLF